MISRKEIFGTFLQALQMFDGWWNVLSFYKTIIDNHNISATIHVGHASVMGHAQQSILIQENTELNSCPPFEQAFVL